MVRSHSRSVSRSRSPSRSRSRSRSKRSKRTSASSGGKKYTVVADSISMIPKKDQEAWCGSCGSKMPIVASKAVLVKLIGRPNYVIMGPCSGCGRQRSRFVAKPSGY